jgi:hypothetical protein
VEGFANNRVLGHSTSCLSATHQFKQRRNWTPFFLSTRIKYGRDTSFDAGSWCSFGFPILISCRPFGFLTVIENVSRSDRRHVILEPFKIFILHFVISFAKTRMLSSNKAEDWNFQLTLCPDYLDGFMLQHIHVESGFSLVESLSYLCVVVSHSSHFYGLSRSVFDNITS